MPNWAPGVYELVDGFFISLEVEVMGIESTPRKENEGCIPKRQPTGIPILVLLVVSFGWVPPEKLAAGGWRYSQS